MYGWPAEARVHWIVPEIGATTVCVALMSAYYCINRYTVETYTKCVASAMAATTFVKSLAALSFPLFAPALDDALRYGWGNSLLALFAFVLGVLAPWLFWFYGPAMRARSDYAAGLPLILGSRAKRADPEQTNSSFKTSCATGTIRRKHPYLIRWPGCNGVIRAAHKLPDLRIVIHIRRSSH